MNIEQVIIVLLILFIIYLFNKNFIQIERLDAVQPSTGTVSTSPPLTDIASTSQPNNNRNDKTEFIDITYPIEFQMKYDLSLFDDIKNKKMLKEFYEKILLKMLSNPAEIMKFKNEYLEVMYYIHQVEEIKKQNPNIKTGDDITIVDKNGVSKTIKYEDIVQYHKNNVKEMPFNILERIILSYHYLYKDYNKLKLDLEQSNKKLAECNDSYNSLGSINKTNIGNTQNVVNKYKEIYDKYNGERAIFSKIVIPPL